MLEKGFLKSHFIGRDGFVWWIGQVAPKETWQSNFGDGALTDDVSTIKGFGERYRVRIMGYHTANKDELPDNELPLATIMYPVTAGGGTGGASQSSNIVAGNFVFGFFMDGEDAQQPVIMGVMGYNEVQQVLNEVPPVGFKPFYGLDGKKPGAGVLLGNSQFTLSQTTGSETDQTSFGTNAQLGHKVDPVSHKLGNSRRATTDHRNPENIIPNYIPSAESTELPTKGIQRELQKAIQSIENLKKSLISIGDEQIESVENIQEKINKKIDIAADAVATGVKWIYEMIEENILSKINLAFEKIYFAATPNERENVENVTGEIASNLACVFRKIFNTMLDMVRDFIVETVNKVVNVPTCFVEKFLGNTLGAISGVLNGTLNSVKDAIGSVTDLAVDGLDLAGDVFEMIGSLISFLSCDDNVNNSPIDEWSHIGGAQQFGKGSLANIINNAKEYGSRFEEISTEDFDFLSNIDLSETLNLENYLDDCSTDPVECGPPLLNIFGSSTGTGAAGNLIINAAGEIIGVDMQSFGIGYDEETRANVLDNCGSGTGGVIRPVFGDVANNFSDNRTNRGSNPGTPANAPSPLGFNNFKKFEYEFNEASDDSIRQQPFSPVRALELYGASSYGTPAFGLGPSFEFGEKAPKDKLSVREEELPVELTVDTFTIPVTKTRQLPVVKFVLLDKVGLEGIDTDFDFTPDDISGPGALRLPEGATEQIEKEVFIFKGSIRSFELYQSGSSIVDRGYSTIEDGEYALSGYGGRANLWNNLDESVEGEVDMIGGSGTGFRVLAEFKAASGTGGNPNNTRYRIKSVINRGSGYEEEDVLTFPNIQGKNISGALPEGSGGISLKVLSTVKRDGFRLTTEENIRGTENEVEDLLNFKKAFEGGQRVRVVKEKEYIVRGFQSDGEALFNPLEISNDGKCLKVDDVKGKKQEVRRIDTSVRPSEADIIWSFGNDREQQLYDQNPGSYFYGKIKNNNRTIELLDGKGDDVNATFSIISGDAKFSDDGLKIIGQGTIQLELEWDDDPEDADTAIEQISIPDVKHLGPNTVWRQTEGESNNDFVERGRDLESIFMESVTEIIPVLVEEGRPGRSDDDYDDLVICTKKGLFKKSRDYESTGALIYKISDDSDPPDEPEEEIDTPFSPFTPEPVLPIEETTIVSVPFGGGGGGGIPGFLTPGPANNSTFHPYPGTTTLGGGKWVPGSVPPGGGGPHVGPAVFIHDEELFGYLIGESGTPFSEGLEGRFGPNAPDDPSPSGGIGGVGPGAPGAPGTPGTPGGPETPGTPGTPETPGAPGTPGTPGTPGAPGTPGGPETPGTPGTPGGPETPGTPGAPGAPGGLGIPGAPGAPGGSERPIPSGPPSPSSTIPPGPGIYYPDSEPSPNEPGYGIPGVMVPPPYGGIGGPGIGIIDIIVEQPGGGYLSIPDGSSGGDGRIYATKCSTYGTYSDGTLIPPRDPGNRMCVNTGDVIILPKGRQVITEPFDGIGGGELIIGGMRHVMQRPGCFTTPECGEAPESENTYPVLMYLCDVIIKKPGFGYKNTDKVIINPSMGAEAELVVDKFGRISDVIITKPGEGFQTIPSITIQSSTGQDALLLGKLCVDRVKDVNLVDQEKVIQVVNCVGKF